jgi:Protein of unknown function (DUF732)
MTIRHKGAILLLAFATGSAIAQAIAPQAHADEGSFVNQLDAHDIPVTPASIPLGHNICSTISADGYDGVTESVTAMLKAGNSSRDTAGFVVFAAHEMCPSTIPAVVAWMNANG